MIVIMRDGIREEIRPDSENRYQRMGHQPTQPMAEYASSEGAQADANNKANNKDSSIPLSEGMSRLLTQAKLVQYASGGESDGFMIASIESGSVYDTIGLEDGDVIEQINGLDIKNPEDALEIYEVVKNKDSFVIDFVRDGNKMGITTMDSNVLVVLFSLYRSGY